jgi:hypothetical protein
MSRSRVKTRTDVAKPAIATASDASRFARARQNMSILHDCGRVPDLAQLLLIGSPWIYTDSYIV